MQILWRFQEISWTKTLKTFTKEWTRCPIGLFGEFNTVLLAKIATMSPKQSNKSDFNLVCHFSKVLIFERNSVIFSVLSYFRMQEQLNLSSTLFEVINVGFSIKICFNLFPKLSKSPNVCIYLDCIWHPVGVCERYLLIWFWKKVSNWLNIKTIWQFTTFGNFSDCLCQFLRVTWP